MYKILMLFYSILHKTLPYNDRVDFFMNYLKFCIWQKRFPKKQNTFNDYLFNIKSSDEMLNPIRQFISDKYLVKDYIRAKVGEKYNVPTIAIFNSYEELENFDFPENCCIKPTQASQAVILRKDNEPIEIPPIKDWFNLNYYKKTRERNYKYLKPKVIVEPLLFKSKDLMDYRLFCFNGKVKIIGIDVGKYTGYKRVFYSPKWEKQDFSLHYPLFEGELECPKNLQEMIAVAEKLAEDLDFIRIDIYSDGEECFVGEITNCHAGANQRFVPESAEKKVSEIIFGES
ncbi:ATP-grasp fold amidoligase family protein [Acinetobacter sp. NIPH 298]|uniref:ATP-grasp fold amidoligase family protein n=1 Tax=Acinetobacter sp. NIPH 298 TaxID=1217692 RepID=UPI0002CE7A60|nr:ATP-grasp fold amidoligase family protein [Acinetobacter sp. NIPH 298]ENW96773.1 hypothetical protein F903_00579 [Acinetobacter sp. NIPH 298]